ncbi:hypothetical protein Rhopal_000406-T1 [Rhodotorula paludigena]|uniref:Uncharacterized protein n=1 Tax=Rhodotorula paludigena TaxID=86838 RepID=A0AAV5GED2_9BASI|nr:hypothetical protein Rhopal_000406-T1 [Rhodotorula paludigena]
MAPLLLPAPVLALLEHLAPPDPPDGAPHSALVAARAQGNQVLVAHSQPTALPWPQVRPDPDAVDPDQRAAMYAALAGGAWDAQRTSAGAADAKEPLMLESELGRIAVVALGAFLLVLVGTELAPWKVLDKKIRAAADQLRTPLECVGA